MFTRLCIAAVVVAVLTGLSTSDVSAQLVVRGIAGTPSEDAYGFGFGGSVGFNLPIGKKSLFLGARGVYHTGQKSSAGVDVTDTGLLMYGLEFGTAFVEKPIIIRSVGWVGVASESTKNLTSGTLVSKFTNNKFLFGPGLLVAIPIGPVQIGVEPRYLRVIGGTSSYVVYGSLGLDIN
ncbi:MAG: hypothetical protein VYA69_15385 [Gemmatimonadota bacterium]|nr:hypothetical protein [Gemmatimonadota bacterium]